MYQKGSGVRLGGAKLKPATLEKIDKLGRMNQRHLDCVEAKDAQGLLILANEYEAMGMKATAKHIRLAVSRMEKKK